MINRFQITSSPQLICSKLSRSLRNIYRLDLDAAHHSLTAACNLSILIDVHDGNYTAMKNHSKRLKQGHVLPFRQEDE